MSGEGLLAGVRVLDLSLLGPAALASHFVDFGAEVIKIEAPTGDYVREMTWPIVEGVSLMHLHINRGKQSLVLDLKTPEALAVFEELVAKSDVIIEAMRPGFLDKRGFTRERLREINPALVFCSISGYGATGPYRDLPAHGIAFDSWAGQVNPVVDDDGFCRIPDQTNIGITAGPAFGAMAVLAALVRARTTGEGAYMEIAQSDAAAYFDWYRIETWNAYKQPDDIVTGNKSDNYERRKPGLGGMWEGVRYQFYESADGHVLFMASEQAFWKNFLVGIGREDLFERFPGSKYADHARGNVEVQSELRDIFRTRTSAEWLEFANEHNTTDRAGQHAADRHRRPAVPGSFHVDVDGADAATSSCSSRCTWRATSNPSRAPRPRSASTPTRCCARSSATTPSASPPSAPPAPSPDSGQPSEGVVGIRMRRNGVH